MGNLPPYAMVNGTCEQQPAGSGMSWDCCPSYGQGIFGEQSRNAWLGVAFPLLLTWFFMGVALSADAFMSSIETITSQIKVTTVTIGGAKKRFHTRVWNDTVANLTLMALGSSAPEILISTIEVAGKGFYSGDLGPSTIVGSAAFNLMVIIAVCVAAIPAGETRTLKHLQVFAVTATFSVFAYLWLIVILVLWTPNFVTSIEAGLTFGFMVVLVALAYAADLGYLSPSGASYASRRLKVLNVHADGGVAAAAAAGDVPAAAMPEISASDVAMYLKALELKAGQPQKEDGSCDKGCGGATAPVSPAAVELSGEQLHGLAAAAEKSPPDGGAAPETPEAMPHSRLRGVSAEAVANELRAASSLPPTTTQSRAAARRTVTRMLKGRATKTSSRRALSIGGAADGAPEVIIAETSLTLSDVERSTFVGFVTPIVRVMEGEDQFAVLQVVRAGCLEGSLSVRFSTRDGTATGGSDYTAVSDGLLELAAGESRGVIKIAILDDDEIEDDEEFFVDLADPAVSGLKAADAVAAHAGGPKLFASCTVVIKDDDVQPGTLRWQKESVRCCESDRSVTLVVERRKGHNGEVSVKYDTRGKSAVEGADFEGRHGTLTFGHGVVSQSLTIPIVDDTSYEKDEEFLVVLSEPTGGAVFPHDTDGFSEQEIVTVTIEANGDVRSKVDRVLELLRIDRHGVLKCHEEWRAQMVDAIYPEDDAGAAGWVVHLLMLPWKLITAMLPPAAVWDGWALFIAALLLIGGQVIFIDEIANQVGCQWQISASVAAITLVALGTSLPDLFASMKAAQDDPTADNSVGNVTGSNSVNVFLGLGLPWLLGALYWEATGVTDEWKERYPSMWRDYVGPDRIYSGHEQGGFVVCAGYLAFSVTVFTVCALTTIVAILARRWLLQPAAELGGPRPIALATAGGFVLLWFIYVIFSIIRDLELVDSWNSMLSPQGECP